MTSTNEKTPAIVKKESFLWWRNQFYRSRWKDWHAKWLELAANTPKEHEDGPEAVLGKLTRISCDPDVALRLAFLEATHKPATQSELAKENARQQRIKRKLGQSRSHLWKAMAGPVQVTKSQVAKDNTQQQHIRRKLDQYRKHVLKAALELERALSDASLIFIKREHIDSLRASADTVKPENVYSLKPLVDMCGHEIETLLWPRELEPPPGHELFTLVAYVKACSGNPNYALVTNLLRVVYQAHGRTAPTQDAIEKQVQRFRKLDSIQPGLIEESTAQRAKSGELRRELLTCYPDQALR